ncbi:MAG TPA: DUF4279 domain-containing protein [Solirubrobacteraceae bacterium]|nr:DUF4279 domain-containing protein [Solirubrobacteraceae bacterium]
MNPWIGGTHNRTLAVLVVLSRTRSLDELMQLIPTRPDKMWQRGASRGREAGNIHKYSGAQYQSQVARTASWAEHLDDLLKRVCPASEALRSFAEQANLEDPRTAAIRLWLYVESKKEATEIEISNRQLQLIAEMGAHLGLSTEFIQE